MIPRAETSMQCRAIEGTVLPIFQRHRRATKQHGYPAHVFKQYGVWQFIAGALGLEKWLCFYSECEMHGLGPRTEPARSGQPAYAGNALELLPSGASAECSGGALNRSENFGLAPLPLFGMVLAVMLGVRHQLKVLHSVVKFVAVHVVNVLLWRKQSPEMVLQHLSVLQNGGLANPAVGVFVSRSHMSILPLRVLPLLLLLAGPGWVQ